MGISRRTVNAAKKSFPNMRTRKVGAKWMWSLEEKTPVDALSEEECEEAEETSEASAEATIPETDSLSEDIESIAEEFSEETAPEAFAACAEDDLSE